MLEPCRGPTVGDLVASGYPSSAQASHSPSGVRGAAACPRATIDGGDLGVSRPRLADRLRERGVVTRRKSPSPEQMLEMTCHYEQGESLARVGARLGVNGGTVHTHLVRAGIPLRDTHGRTRQAERTPQESQLPALLPLPQQCLAHESLELTVHVVGREQVFQLCPVNHHDAKVLGRET